MTSRLALGTAQFGLDYGVANDEGKVPYEKVVWILSLARENALDMLDTAISYGDSEDVLGRIGLDFFCINSKLPPLPVDTDNL